MCVCVCVYGRYLVLVLDERPQLAFALPALFLLALPGVGQAGLRHRPRDGLAVVLKVHVPRGLEPGFVGLHHLLGVLGGAIRSQKGTAVI